MSLFRTYGALFEEDVRITTAADPDGALAVAWILPTANAASLTHREVVSDFPSIIAQLTPRAWGAGGVSC